MKLVILERYALKDGDLDWSEIRELADEVETYPRTCLLYTSDAADE